MAKLAGVATKTKIKAKDGHEVTHKHRRFAENAIQAAVLALLGIVRDAANTPTERTKAAKAIDALVWTSLCPAEVE